MNKLPISINDLTEKGTGDLKWKMCKKGYHWEKGIESLFTLGRKGGKSQKLNIE